MVALVDIPCVEHTSCLEGGACEDLDVVAVREGLTGELADIPLMSKHPGPRPKRMRTGTLSYLNHAPVGYLMSLTFESRWLHRRHQERAGQTL